MMHTVSVVMATYNGEKYIEEQLKSIIEQSYPVTEIIIQDDISQDKTKEIINSFIQSRGVEDMIRFYENEHNLGYASNFVTALMKATGDYVLFCDQDDIWLPDRVEKMVRVLSENDSVELIGTEFDPFKCSEDAPDVPGWELAKFKNDDSLEKLDFNSENLFIGCQGCTMAMKKTFLDKILPYWYEGWAHDEFVWKLALSMNALYFFHAVTLKRRLHSSNVTLHKEHKKEQRMKYLSDLLKSHLRTKEFIEEYVRKAGSFSDNEISEKCKLLDRHIHATKMRLELISKKKISNVIKLFFYIDCYHKARSIPVELMIALK